MHTEEEAKKLWCPHVRVLEPSFYKRAGGTRGDLIGYEPASVNRDAKCKDTNCIGSSCSQWRWSNTFKDNGSPILDGTGYCGLAGKP